MAPPLPVCYLNGEFLPLQEARISPLDRGFLFADAVYEVMPVYGGRPFRFEQHFQRLANSLSAIRLRSPLDDAGWRQMVATLIAKNGGGDLYIYLQISRGAENGRNPAPLPDLHTVFAFCAPLPVASAAVAVDGVRCITAQDTRWARCDIKSVALLANILSRQQAVDAGAAEMVLLRDGYLTEASSATVHIVERGRLLTPPESQQILPGVTRGVVDWLAAQNEIDNHAEMISEERLRAADELLLSSSLRCLQPITRLDGRPIGDGRPGPIWRRLSAAFMAFRVELAAQPW